MSASAHIYLVMDAGSPVAAFTVQHEMKAYLKRRLETFTIGLFVASPMLTAAAFDRWAVPPSLVGQISLTGRARLRHFAAPGPRTASMVPSSPLVWVLLHEHAAEAESLVTRE